MATYLTSYDQGHRHKVTIPECKAIRVRNRGAMSGTPAALGQFTPPKWYRVYEGTQFIGWAWADPGSAALFSNNCLMMRTQAQTGWWDQIFGPRNPQYEGASAWFQVWHRGMQSFLGWYDIGYFTAKKIPMACPQLDVFTSQGQPIL